MQLSEGSVMEQAAWLRQTVSTKVSDTKAGGMYSSLHPVWRQGTAKSPQKRNVPSRRTEAAAKTMKQEFKLAVCFILDNVAFTLK